MSQSKWSNKINKLNKINKFNTRGNINNVNISNLNSINIIPINIGISGSSQMIKSDVKIDASMIFEDNPPFIKYTVITDNSKVDNIDYSNAIINNMIMPNYFAHPTVYDYSAGSLNDPSGRKYHKACIVDNSMFIFGGQTEDINYLNEFYEYDIFSIHSNKYNKWYKRSLTNNSGYATDICGRIKFTGEKWRSSDFVIFGGQTEDSSYTNTMDVIDLKNSTFYNYEYVYNISGGKNDSKIKINSIDISLSTYSDIINDLSYNKKNSNSGISQIDGSNVLYYYRNHSVIDPNSPYDICYNINGINMYNVTIEISNNTCFNVSDTNTYYMYFSVKGGENTNDISFKIKNNNEEISGNLYKLKYSYFNFDYVEQISVINNNIQIQKTSEFLPNELIYIYVFNNTITGVINVSIDNSNVYYLYSVGFGKKINIHKDNSDKLSRIYRHIDGDDAYIYTGLKDGVSSKFIPTFGIGDISGDSSFNSFLFQTKPDISNLENIDPFDDSIRNVPLMELVRPKYYSQITNKNITLHHLDNPNLVHDERTIITERNFKPVGYASSRYFHTSKISNNNLYVYGGITEKDDDDDVFNIYKINNNEISDNKLLFSIDLKFIDVSGGENGDSLPSSTNYFNAYKGNTINPYSITIEPYRDTDLTIDPNSMKGISGIITDTTKNEPPKIVAFVTNKGVVTTDNITVDELSNANLWYSYFETKTNTYEGNNYPYQVLFFNNYYSYQRNNKRMLFIDSTDISNVINDYKTYIYDISYNGNITDISFGIMEITDPQYFSLELSTEKIIIKFKQEHSIYNKSTNHQQYISFNNIFAINNKNKIIHGNNLINWASKIKKYTSLGYIIVDYTTIKKNDYSGEILTITSKLNGIKKRHSHTTELIDNSLVNFGGINYVIDISKNWAYTHFDNNYGDSIGDLSSALNTFINDNSILRMVSYYDKINKKYTYNMYQQTNDELIHLPENYESCYTLYTKNFKTINTKQNDGSDKIIIGLSNNVIDVSNNTYRNLQDDDETCKLIGHTSVKINNYIHLLGGVKSQKYKINTIELKPSFEYIQNLFKVQKFIDHSYNNFYDICKNDPSGEYLTIRKGYIDNTVNPKRRYRINIYSDISINDVSSDNTFYKMHKRDGSGGLWYNNVNNDEYRLYKNVYDISGFHWKRIIKPTYEKMIELLSKFQQDFGVSENIIYYIYYDVVKLNESLIKNYDVSTNQLNNVDGSGGLVVYSSHRRGRDLRSPSYILYRKPYNAIHFNWSALLPSSGQEDQPNLPQDLPRATHYNIGLSQEIISVNNAYNNKKYTVNKNTLKIDSSSNISNMLLKYHSCSLWGDNSLVVFGGMKDEIDNNGLNPINKIIISNDLFIINVQSPESNHKKYPVSDISGRWGHTSDISGDKLTIYGGFDADGNAFNNKFIIDLSHIVNSGYTSQNVKEKKTKNYNPGNIGGHTMTNYDNKYIIFGGSDKSYDICNNYTKIWELIELTDICGTPFMIFSDDFDISFQFQLNIKTNPENMLVYFTDTCNNKINDVSSLYIKTTNESNKHKIIIGVSGDNYHYKSNNTFDPELSHKLHCIYEKTSSKLKLYIDDRLEVSNNIIFNYDQSINFMHIGHVGTTSNSDVTIIGMDIYNHLITDKTEIPSNNSHLFSFYPLANTGKKLISNINNINLRDNNRYNDISYGSFIFSSKNSFKFKLEHDNSTINGKLLEKKNNNWNWGKLLMDSSDIIQNATPITNVDVSYQFIFDKPYCLKKFKIVSIDNDMSNILLNTYLSTYPYDDPNNNNGNYKNILQQEIDNRPKKIAFYRNAIDYSNNKVIPGKLYKFKNGIINSNSPYDLSSIYNITIDNSINSYIDYSNNYDTDNSFIDISTVQIKKYITENSNNISNYMFVFDNSLSMKDSSFVIAMIGQYDKPRTVEIYNTAFSTFPKPFSISYNIYNKNNSRDFSFVNMKTSNNDNLPGSSAVLFKINTNNENIDICFNINNSFKDGKLFEMNKPHFYTMVDIFFKTNNIQTKWRNDEINIQNPAIQIYEKDISYIINEGIIKIYFDGNDGGNWKNMLNNGGLWGPMGVSPNHFYYLFKISYESSKFPWKYMFKKNQREEINKLIISTQGYGNISTQGYGNISTIGSDISSSDLSFVSKINTIGSYAYVFKNKLTSTENDISFGIKKIETYNRFKTKNDFLNDKKSTKHTIDLSNIYFYNTENGEMIDLSYNNKNAILDYGDLKIRNHSATIIDNSMYVFGGINNGKVSNKLHILNLTTGKWDLSVNYSGDISMLYGHTADSCGDINGNNDTKIAIFGGSTEKGVSKSNYNDKLFIYDIIDNSMYEFKLNKDNQVKPEHVFGHSSVVINSKYLYVFGGDISYSSSDNINRDSLYILDLLDKKKWIKRNNIQSVSGNNHLMGRYRFSMVYDNCTNELITYGGEDTKSHNIISKNDSSYIQIIENAGNLYYEKSKFDIHDISFDISFETSNNYKIDIPTLLLKFDTKIKKIKKKINNST